MTEIRCKVELREDDTRQSPGRLTGTLLTYGERASDRPELFERGAFDLDAIKASGGIVINRQHTRGAPIMRVIPELRGVLYGIPNVLTSGSGSETQTREAFRRFVLTAIEPLALIVSRDLTRVFEQPIELDLSELAHADIAGRARAFKALVGSGMPPADAAEFVKIEV